MSRKNTMRDNVNGVRARLPQLSDLPRDKIELAPIRHETNVETTVDAFARNGTTETSTKRDPPTSSPTVFTASTSVLRPSQRVSNIFQNFAGGSSSTVKTNGLPTVSNLTTSSPISLPPVERPVPTIAPVSTPATLESLTNELHDQTDHVVPPEEVSSEQKPMLSRRRKSVKNRHGSSSSVTHQHEQSAPGDRPTSAKRSHTPLKSPARKSSSSNPKTISSNRKILTKSVKDLQRQTSTLTNVEIVFQNEIQSSIKRIDDIFKHIREIIKEREVELYLQIDQVKEQGLNLIHRRQHRASELRQRMDRCDRLEPDEIDTLRYDVKQFVTDRRYDLGEELTSLHRFEYDQSLIESLKQFGHVSTVDRKNDRTRSASTSSALIESNGALASNTEGSVSDLASEKFHATDANSRTTSVSSSINNMPSPIQEHQALPQRTSHRATEPHDNTTGDVVQASSPPGPTNEHDDPNAQRQRPRPTLSNLNGNHRRNPPKPANDHAPLYNNNESKTTYRRPRPAGHSMVPVQS